MSETSHLRFLPCGEAALMVELADLGQALTLLDLLLANLPVGVDEVVPAARTVLIQFNPIKANALQLSTYIRSLDLSRRSERSGQEIEIPVIYDGADLADVAELLGWSVETVIRRHSEAEYKVAFCGFAPGFAYLSGSDDALTVPRRQSPRVKIPAGSVALAGAFCGIYPSDTPGGWQILGHTPLHMWNIERSRPALLAPGDRVHFRNISRGSQVLLDPAAALKTHLKAPTHGRLGFEVTRADRPILFQDLGRAGQAAQGVSRSGAADRKNLRQANELVGNPGNYPALEIALGGVTLRSEIASVFALSGAVAPLTIRTIKGQILRPDLSRPFAIECGDELSIGFPERGLFSYLALRGGFDVTPVLGSASYDTLAKIGPLPLVAGSRLYAASTRVGSVQVDAAERGRLPKPGESIDLDVILGPRDDWFTAEGIDTFFSQAWSVSPESNRVGKRLTGKVPVTRRDGAELPSEAAIPGSIQIPHNGQPVLFLADHPLTGGYPVIAVVAAHHLDLASQIPPGAGIRFRSIPRPLS